MALAWLAVWPVTWIAFTAYGLNSKWSKITSIGGGFVAGLFSTAIVIYLQELLTNGTVI